MIPVTEILQLQRRWIKLQPTVTYQEIGVRSFGNGIFHKAPVAGSTLGNKRVLRIEPGDLVFNNVFAWEGAVAVAGPDEAGLIGSHRFVTYTVNPERSTARFLKLFFTTKPGLEILRKASPGSAGRNKTLGLDRFIAQSIPLPSVAEQLRLVERIDALAAKVEEAKTLRHESSLEAEALINSARRRLIGDAPASTWVPLSVFVEQIENGWSPPCEKRPAAIGEWGVLKVGAVSFGRYDPRENKALPVSLVPMPEYEVKPGDFLMSRANTYELVGACALVETTPPRLMLSDKHFRFIFRKQKYIDLQYLDHVLKSPALRTQIIARATGTSPTMKNISKDKVFHLLVPNHDSAEQQRLARRMDDIHRQTKVLIEMQTATARELDALIPGILDRAFNGEL
jgi:type I restriction enzyme S subunit